MAELPEWAERALALRNSESIMIVDRRTQAQVSATLQRLRAMPEEAAKDGFKLRATVKAGIWVLCRKDWPHTFFAPRSPNKSGVNPIANIRKPKNAT